MTRDFHLGFEFLRGHERNPDPLLFDADTKRVIAKLAIPASFSVQYKPPTKDVPNVTDFLQGEPLSTGKPKRGARGSATRRKDLGLRFKPFHPRNPTPTKICLSGFMLSRRSTVRSCHPCRSCSLRQARPPVQQMHQAGALSLVEAETVARSVRQDITAHSSFVLTIVAAAWEKLANMDEADRKFFDFLSPEKFLRDTPMSTVRWLQSAISLLSHRREQGRWARYSFATWLVPFVEQQVLHLDVVAGITTEGYHALLALPDKVAVAWRSDKTPSAGGWAGRLAQVAGCTRSTVYNRRDKWRQKYGIDIARPLQMYSDILYFGHNSIARPESITALMVAVDQEDGDEAVRLHADAIADFERKRVEIVNPALVNPPRAMELMLPPPIASPALDEFDDLPPDFDDADLDEAVPTSPAWTRPIAAPALARSNPHEVGRGPMKEPGKVVFKVRRCPPPPSTERAVTLSGAMPSPLPPTHRTVRCCGDHAQPTLAAQTAGHNKAVLAHRADQAPTHPRRPPGRKVIPGGPCPAHPRRPPGRRSSCGGPCPAYPRRRPRRRSSCFTTPVRRRRPPGATASTEPRTARSRRPPRRRSSREPRAAPSPLRQPPRPDSTPHRPGVASGWMRRSIAKAGTIL